MDYTNKQEEGKKIYRNDPAYSSFQVVWILNVFVFISDIQNKAWQHKKIADWNIPVVKELCKFAEWVYVMPEMMDNHKYCGYCTGGSKGVYLVFHLIKGTTSRKNDYWILHIQNAVLLLPAW